MEEMQLSRDELHVWAAALDIAPQQVGQFRETLSPDERSRADRFYFERDRRHFITARGILRTIIASYLEITPSALQFSYNEFGKPELEESHKIGDLKFNVSHSGGLALVAVAMAREVGVDLEAIDRSVQIDELARHFFSANENASLSRLAPSQRFAGFFNCWTRKEAYIKARGMGLSIPLDSFDVSLNPGDPADLIRLEDATSVSVWQIENLEVAPGFTAAIAAAGCNWKVARLSWPNSVEPR
jgi:4'-phosphopantetheinyl transferase